MNKNTHRLVFNKSRSCVVAVSETARGCSKCASGTSSPPKRRCKRSNYADTTKKDQFFLSNHSLAQQIRAQEAPIFIVIASPPGEVTVPNSALYRINPTTSSGPANTFVVQTDPRFTNYRSWLSSDYMLQALNTNPSNILKRLGDGFYEQRLINEQVGQLTGRRFLENCGKLGSDSN